MLNSLIYKKLTRHAALRSDLVTEHQPSDSKGIETFRNATECAHFVTSMSACKAVLTDDESFSPSPIAEAVRTIGDRFNLDVEAAFGFLRENPMQLSDETHTNRRKEYLSHYAATLKGLSKGFQPIAEECLDALVQSPPQSLVKDLVEPFIDGVLRYIACAHGVAPETYANVSKGNNVLLEHVHHPRKLEQKARQIASFTAHRNAQDNILLSYILQGRDPMIGGITAFLRSLICMTAADRSHTLAETTSASVFRLTSPVNYIGRMAQRAISIEGADIFPGDQVLLLLPDANGDPSATADKRGVPFGAGRHTCAGQALALSITDAFLTSLRSHHDTIDWSMLQPDTPVPAVFRQYKAQP